jgi:hypothetical protein
MKYKEAVSGLLVHIKNCPGPKEAEWLLQDAITTLLRKRTGKEDFAAFVNMLHQELYQQREQSAGMMDLIKLNSVIDIVEDYQTLI